MLQTAGPEKRIPGDADAMPEEPFPGWGLRTKTAELPMEEADMPEWVHHLRAYIRENLSRDLSLKCLAEICHFHPVYLSRTWRKLTGVTLSDYIGGVRLEKARTLLRESRISIVEISRRTGFTTSNYFCRWFRKQTGTSPLRYREKQSGNPGTEKRSPV